MVNLIFSSCFEKWTDYFIELDGVFVARFFVSNLDVEMGVSAVFHPQGPLGKVSVIHSEKVSILKEYYVLFFLNMNASASYLRQVYREWFVSSASICRSSMERWLALAASDLMAGLWESPFIYEWFNKGVVFLTSNIFLYI